MVELLRDPLGLTGAAAKRLVYVYSVVDRQLFHPLPDANRLEMRKSLGIAGDQFAIGYVGAFNDKKGQLGLLTNATPSLVNKLPTARVYLAGDFEPDQNRYAERCRKAVAELGMGSHVHFLGFHSQMAAWYQAWDLVVLASRSEGLARSMIESLACGTPVASFEVCSAREILIDHDCGRLAAQGDYVALVETIVELAFNPALRRALGNRGAQVAAQFFRPEVAVRRYEALYKDLATRWSRAS